MLLQLLDDGATPHRSHAHQAQEAKALKRLAAWAFSASESWRFGARWFGGQGRISRKLKSNPNSSKTPTKGLRLVSFAYGMILRDPNTGSWPQGTIIWKSMMSGRGGRGGIVENVGCLNFEVQNRPALYFASNLESPLTG